VEKTSGRPDRVASALQIMLEGPMARPRSTTNSAAPISPGYFRAFEMKRTESSAATSNRS